MSIYVAFPILRYRKRYVQDHEIVSAIWTLTQESGYPPSLNEVSETVGLGKTALRYRLDRLAEQGIVTWDRGLSRTITIVRNVGVNEHGQK